ncbi:MAG: hypothetical protein ABJN26_15410 [Stappiaceae bacterium]
MRTTIIAASMAAAALSMTAAPAHAMHIKDFNLDDRTGEHEIHVRFDASKNNWAKATSKSVTFKLQWYLRVYSLKAIQSTGSSWLQLSVLGSPDALYRHTLKENRSRTGILNSNIEWHVQNKIKVPGKDLILAPSAVSACQKLYAQGKRPTQSHRVYIGQITTKAEANVANLAALTYQVRHGTKTTVSDVYAVCDKDPNWKPPPRAGNPLQIANFAVHPHGNSASCPKRYDLKVVFRAKWAKTIKFRVRKSGQLSKLHTVTLAKQGQHYQARFDQSYVLDPGVKTFQIEVRDGPKSTVITKDVICPPFKVISTFLNYTHGAETHCPKVVAETTTFKTTRPGWIRYEIKHESGFVVAKGKATAKRSGSSYMAVVTRQLPFKEAFDGHMMAEVTGQSGANSGWTPLKVNCPKAQVHGTATNDLAPDSNGGDELPPTPYKLIGDFSFVDHGAPKCARTGKALISFKSTKPDPIGYALYCHNKPTMTGMVHPVKHASGGYVGVALKSFEISKTTRYTCELWAGKTTPKRKMSRKSHAFHCISPVGETGAVDLVPQTRPTDTPKRREIIDHRAKKAADAAKRRKVAEKRRKQAADAAKRRQVAEERRKKTADAAKRRQVAEDRRKRAAEKAKRRQVAEDRRKKAAETAKRRKVITDRRKKAADAAKRRRIVEERKKKAAETSKRRKSAIPAKRKVRALKLRRNKARR